MKNNLGRYFFEYLLLVTVILLTLAGFWNIYFGATANPDAYQTLHLATVLIWLFLLLLQLGIIGKKQYLNHRRVGLSILVIGPLLVATTALLAVHSAHKDLGVPGGDPMIVGNVMATLELGSIILVAFILKKRRALHGAFLLSTSLLFLGIAVFFMLLGFVPQFKIEGPETFHRFETAGTVGSYVCLVIGILFFVKDRRNGWPMLLVGSFHVLNAFINIFLIKYDVIQPLTEIVGSFNKSITFIGSFMITVILLSVPVMAERKLPRARVPLADPSVGV